MTPDNEQLVLEAAADILRNRGEGKKAAIISDGKNLRGHPIKPPPPDATILQKRTYERLIAVGHSQLSISKSIGLGPDFIRCIMDGRSKDPGVAKMFRLAKGLGCSVEYLIGLDDKP